MTEISSEAQALIDRLARMDPARPRNDKAAIERALTAHLKALGLPERPFFWAQDAEAGFWRVRDTGIAMAGDLWWRTDAAPVMRLTHNSVLATAQAYDLGDAARAALASLWETTWIGMWNAIHMWNAVYAVPYRTTLYRMSKAGMTAPWDEEQDFLWKAAIYPTVAIAYAVGQDARPDSTARSPEPSTRRVMTIWRPVVEAIEAGLFLYWVTAREVVCVLQPRISVENGRLHAAQGPAVSWPTGEQYFFWHGVQVPDWIIEQPARVTVEAIRAEPNQEIRRCMTEIYGLPRYLRDAGATLVHEDECGKLWEAQVGEETWRIVEVEDGTAGLDGKRRVYTLDVTGAERALGWPIETARAAVAATYGLRPEEYSPEVRT